MQRSVITALSLAAALLAWQPIAASAQAIQVRYGQIENSVRSMSSLALHTAQRKGFFAREGLDVKVMLLPGVHHMIDGLDKNIVDISHTATPYLVQGVLKGSDAVGVIGAPANSIFSLIAKPDIADYMALQGKLVGMSLPMDTISIASRMLLAKHGLKEPAFKTKELIGTPIRATCLSSGECDAVPLGQPDDIVFMQKGFRKLGDSLEVMPVLQFSVIAARRAPGRRKIAIRCCASRAPSALPTNSLPILPTGTKPPASFPK
jgi:ABC-type nitrate/sulfonate/bicarbonate transport system substrate-binding protein